MNILDIRTLLLGQLATGVLSTLVIASLWRQHRERYAGLSLWLADFALQSVASLLFGLRGLVPDWLSIVVAGTLAITGAFLGYVGLERFVGRPGRQWHNCALLVVFVLVHSYYTLARPSLTARTLNIAIALFILCGQCLWLMLRRVNPELSRITRGVGFIFGAYCLVCLVRIVQLSVEPFSTEEFLKGSLTDALFVLSYQLLLILLTFGMVLLVTDRLRLELHSQEEKFSKAFHSSSFAITLSRLADGLVQEINDGFLRITGYQRSEVIRKSSLDLQLWAKNEDRTEVVGELLQGRPVHVKEYLFRKKSGELLLGQFSADVMDVGGERWAVATIIDITERKQAEADRLTLSKLESTGILAGGIAHDFNNLLAIILLNLDLAQASLGSEDELTDSLEGARQGALAAQKLTQQLLTFARGGQPARRLADPAPLLREWDQLALSDSRVAVRCTLDRDLWRVKMDEGQIAQVIRNLVLNAQETMPQGGVVSIRAVNVELGAGGPPTLPRGDYLKVSVTDEGEGIPPEVLPKIFDPYFSTKQRGAQKGMGLGLTICHSVIQKHEGTITVESVLGEGTTFHVYLPASREEAPLEETVYGRPDTPFS